MSHDDHTTDGPSTLLRPGASGGQRPDMRPSADFDPVRPIGYSPRRARWPGLLAAGTIGAAIAGVVLYKVVDEDASVAPAPSIASRSTAPAAATPTIPDALPSANPTQGSSVAVASGTDESITVAVKAALAADPALGEQPIDVRTQAGVVTLTGPAADEPSRERATQLAAAPQGVQRVDNRLTVAPAKGA
ncbi:MAG: BON domain-containing protein [Rubrivivax sp.]